MDKKIIEKYFDNKNAIREHLSKKHPEDYKELVRLVAAVILK